MRRASLPMFMLLLLGPWSACSGQESKVDSGSGAASGTAGSGGSLSLDPIAGGAAGEAAASGAGSPPSGPAIEECENLTEFVSCSETSSEATYSAANVLLVIDKSGSMDDQPEGFEMNKWEALKTALGPALREVAEEMSLGLLLYPFDEQREIPLDDCVNCCVVPSGAAAIRVEVGPGTETAQQVLDALDEVGPGGGTPTAKALEAAFDYFDAGAGSQLEGERFVLLATDGGPNCNGTLTCDADACTSNLDGQCPAGNCCDGEGTACLDDAEVLAQIEALAEIDVPTFVVGIPGTEHYASYLDAFAQAGGVPNPQGPDYYAVSGEGGVEGLTQTFIDITTHLVRDCEFPIDARVLNQQLVNVAIDCELVPYDLGAGWELNDQVLVLGEESCDRLQGEGARRVDVIIGCEQVQ